MNISRNALIIGVLGLAGISAPAIAFDWGQLLGRDGVCTRACVVTGAETEDAVSAAIHAKKGSGPKAGLAADRRIATDVVPVGQLENGLIAYSFKFIWEDRVRVGVFADELLERADTKAAVLTLPNGLLGVDYAQLGLRMATQEQWQQSGVAALKAGYRPQTKRWAAAEEPVLLINKQ